MEKNNQKNMDKEIKKYIDIVFEKFKDEVGLVAEQYLSVDRKLEKIGERLDSIEEILQKHSLTLIEHSKILKEYAQILKRLEQQVSEIRLDLKQKVSIDDFKELQKRVISLEQRVYQLSRTK